MSRRSQRRALRCASGFNVFTRLHQIGPTQDPPFSTRTATGICVGRIRDGSRRGGRPPGVTLAVEVGGWGPYYWSPVTCEVSMFDNIDSFRSTDDRSPRLNPHPLRVLPLHSSISKHAFQFVRQPLWPFQ